MKKIFLATALAAVSLTSVSADTSKAGKGWYVAGQVGYGAFFLLGDGTFYKNESGKLTALTADDSKTI